MSIVREDTMQREVHAYADELRENGRHKDIQVYRYSTRRNNYGDRDPRAYDYYSGYAVRFSTTEEEDRRISPGRDNPPKFHDRSIVLFCDGGGIPMDKLWPHGRIMADIGGEGVEPMWLGWRSPFEDSDKYNPDRITAGFKRSSDTRKDGEYPVWPDGPLTYFYVVFDKDEPARFTRGDEPAAMTDR